MDKKLFITRLLLIGFALGNLLIGSAGLIGGDFSLKVFAAYYGAHFELAPATSYIIRMLGAYVVVFGVLGAVAAFNPAKNRMIIDGIILLLVIRVAQRFFFAPQILDTFGISYGHNLTQAVFFLAIAVGLFVLRPKKEQV